MVLNFGYFGLFPFIVMDISTGIACTMGMKGKTKTFGIEGKTKTFGIAECPERIRAKFDI